VPTISRKSEIGIFAVFKKGQNGCTQRKTFLEAMTWGIWSQSRPILVETLLSPQPQHCSTEIIIIIIEILLAVFLVTSLC